MTRREFLNELYRRLGKMSREEAEQYLTYYAEMLADRMEEGMTEEEAVASMEDVETIAARIRQERAEEGNANAKESASPPSYPDPPHRPEGDRGDAFAGRGEEEPEPRWGRRLPRWLLPVALAAVLLVCVFLLPGPGGQRGVSISGEGIYIGGLVTINPDGILLGRTLYVGPNGIRIGESALSAMGAGMLATESDIDIAIDTTSNVVVTEEAVDHGILTGDYRPSGEYTVSAEGIQTIEVDWVSGGVWIEPWDGEEILLTEESTVELDEETALCYEVVDSTLSIRFSQEPLTNFNGGKALTVQLPRALAEGGLAGLSVETTSADVDLEGVSGGDLEISTTSGNATVYGGSFSTAALATTSGDMTMAGDVPEVELSSTSGDLTLEGGGSLLDVTASTVSGDVFVLLPEDSETVRLDWETASGDLDTGSHAVIQGGGSGLSGEAGVTLRVSTVSGDLLLA